EAGQAGIAFARARHTPEFKKAAWPGNQDLAPIHIFSADMYELLTGASIEPEEMPAILETDTDLITIDLQPVESSSRQGPASQRHFSFFQKMVRRESCDAEEDEGSARQMVDDEAACAPLAKKVARQPLERQLGTGWLVHRHDHLPSSGSIAPGSSFEKIERNFQITSAILFRLGQPARIDIDLQCMKNELWHWQGPVASFACRHEFFLGLV